MASINPSQDYDIIHTLTFDASEVGAGKTCPIQLRRGYYNIGATVYYRAGTSGGWTSLSVASDGTTTFPVSSTTMQIGHSWNKSGNEYMTPMFNNRSNVGGKMKTIAISQKEPLSGVIGDRFMYLYAYNCTSLTALDVPDTSGLTSVGNNFMVSYADSCSSLTALDVPDTSAITSVGDMFMNYYAYNCPSLTTLNLPKAGWFKTNNVDWSVPAERLGVLKGNTTTATDQADWQALTTSGNTLYTNYIRSAGDVLLDGAELGTGNFLPFFLGGN